MSLISIRQRLEQEKGKHQQVLEQISDTQIRLITFNKKLDDIIKAQTIIQLVAQQTQNQLQASISDLVTLALQSIFPEPYNMRCEFVQRRGRTEADLLFERSGHPHNPMLSSGGGPVDVGAFGLRVSLWSLSKATRPVIILDEPMKHLSADLRPRAAELIHMLSQELGIQFIIITHAEEFIEGADKVFYVSLRNGISKVEI